MLELIAMLSLEVNEKEQAPLGQRIRAVGMCFYKKGDLKKGNYYQLRRNRDNPKDTNCFEVRSRYITMVQIMKCSLGNNYLYGSNSERLSLLEVTGKDSRISFDDECTEIPFTLLLFYYLRSL